MSNRGEALSSTEGNHHLSPPPSYDVALNGSEPKRLLDDEEKGEEEEASSQERTRGYWKNPWDFLFSCISVSVGLGNVWRFPYLCYKNSGGVFLIIYFITMIFCGIPIFLMEVAIGQYLGAGGMTTIGQICPILKGVGIATMVMVTFYNIYYCIIVAWSLFYFIASFVSIPGLPWDSCGKKYLFSLPPFVCLSPANHFPALPLFLLPFPTQREESWVHNNNKKDGRPLRLLLP
eukprot:TRINITY_DN754_c1_g1_i6.p1 TRINITY_DN754_c1_g1~~TRINITY_DN754_c1_g1_i6.p1  ORF type:complete len:233 (+),score=52.33 TRINITY_DN754_c1_g1_i6:82-780(+)